jgi:hypothetical protein
VSRMDLATGMKWDKAGAKQWDPWDLYPALTC